MIMIGSLKYKLINEFKNIVKPYALYWFGICLYYIYFKRIPIMNKWSILVKRDGWIEFLKTKFKKITVSM